MTDLVPSGDMTAGLSPQSGPSLNDLPVRQFDVDPPTKVAAVMLGLGPELAKEVFKKLNEGEIRAIAHGAKNLKKQSADVVPWALARFVEVLEHFGSDAMAGEAMLRELAAEAVGDDVVQRAFEDDPPPPPPREVLGAVAEADAESLAVVLSRESPQTIALVLSSLGPDSAQQIITHIPADMHAAVIARMANIDTVAPEVLREVGQALALELRSVDMGSMRRVDGREAALEILRKAQGVNQNDVVAAIEQVDAPLADDLRSKLFTFEDVMFLQDKDIQVLLKDFDSNILMVALKGSSPAVAEKVMANMSSRAAEMLADDMSSMGPVRLTDVEEAQDSLTRIIMTKADEGVITIPNPSEKML